MNMQIKGPSKRTINGKKYEAISMNFNKAKAEASAKDWRNRNRLARVIPSVFKNEILYTVYVHWKSVKD